MQYTIDTINIEMSRLHRTIRRLKSDLPGEGAADETDHRIREIEGQIRELKKAIGVLRKYDRSNSEYSPNNYSYQN